MILTYSTILDSADECVDPSLCLEPLFSINLVHPKQLYPRIDPVFGAMLEEKPSHEEGVSDKTTQSLATHICGGDDQANITWSSVLMRNNTRLDHCGHFLFL